MVISGLNKILNVSTKATNFSGNLQWQAQR